MKNWIGLLRFASLFLFSANAMAQSEATAIMLTLKPGAAANALGGAQAALANDIFAAYYNPAGLAQTRLVIAGFFQTDIWLPDQPQTFVGAAYHTKLGTFALNYSNLTVASPFFDTLPQESDYQRVYQISFARSAGELWLVGGSLKHFRDYRAFVDKAYTAWSFDVGVQVINLWPRATLSQTSTYHFPVLRKWQHEPRSGLSIGLALQNTGPDKVTYLAENQSDPLPQMLRAGLAYHAIDYEAFQFLIAFDVVKELVQSDRDGVDNFLKAWFTSWDDGFDDVHFGAELSFFRLLAFRVGQDRIYNLYQGATDNEVTFGLGIGPEFARLNIVRRGFPMWSEPKWVADISVGY